MLCGIEGFSVSPNSSLFVDGLIILEITGVGEPGSSLSSSVDVPSSVSGKSSIEKFGVSKTFSASNIVPVSFPTVDSCVIVPFEVGVGELSVDFTGAGLGLPSSNSVGVPS